MEENGIDISNKMNWTKFIDHTLNVTMYENYGVVHSPKKDDKNPMFYEIVFKTGKLVDAFDEGLLLEAVREGHLIKIFIPFTSIKCVEIF